LVEDEPVTPSSPGVEPDYHPISAFYESWRSMRDVPLADRPSETPTTND
jgi:hypothetical protein